jgi:hypothetical protein
MRQNLQWVLPNLHRITFDLKRLGKENTNEIFVKGTVGRK